MLGLAERVCLYLQKLEICSMKPSSRPAAAGWHGMNGTMDGTTGTDIVRRDVRSFRPQNTKKKKIVITVNINITSIGDRYPTPSNKQPTKKERKGK